MFLEDNFGRDSNEDHPEDSHRGRDPPVMDDDHSHGSASEEYVEVLMSSSEHRKLSKRFDY